VHVDLLRERALEPGHVLGPTRSRGALAGRGPDWQRQAGTPITYSQTISPLTRTTWPLTRSPSLPTRRDDAGRVLDRTKPLHGGVKKVWEADTLGYPKSGKCASFRS
jgi:hypothetical protein